MSGVHDGATMIVWGLVVAPRDPAAPGEGEQLMSRNLSRWGSTPQPDVTVADPRWEPGT